MPDIEALTNMAKEAVPYVLSFAAACGGFLTVLKTGWGGNLLDSIVKHNLDKRMAEIKLANDIQIGVITHSYTRDIEALKSELSQSTGREYQALLDVWDKFTSAYHATHGITGALYEVPDLDRMTADELEDWLRNCSLSPNAVKLIKESHKKNVALIRVIKINRMSDAEKAVWAVQDTLRRQSVFIPASLENSFNEAIQVLRDVHVEIDVYFDLEGPKERTAQMAFHEKHKSMFDEIKSLVRARVLRQNKPPSIPS